MPELSEIPLVKKRERRQNSQSITPDEERLDPHGVGNFKKIIIISRPLLSHLDSEEELSARISDV